MKLQTCLHCGTRVIPTGDNECPSCRRSFAAQTVQNPSESPSDSPDDGGQSRTQGSILLKTLCTVVLLVVLVSALCLAPSGPFADGDVCGVALLHMLVATLCLNIVLLNTSGPNVVANHGGIGLLVGLVISFIFIAPLKGGLIVFLFGAFPGAVFGLVIGAIRRSVAGVG